MRHPTENIFKYLFVFIVWGQIINMSNEVEKLTVQISASKIYWNNIMNIASI